MQAIPQCWAHSPQQLGAAVQGGNATPVILLELHTCTRPGDYLSPQITGSATTNLW